MADARTSPGKASQLKAEATKTEYRWALAAFPVLAAGLFVASFKISTSYSYWLDELYSVTSSRESLASLYHILLTDVHPPLYPLLLKLWMSVFGDSEPATRFLSWLFAVAALYPLLSFAKRYGAVFLFCCIVIFSSNMLFAYYANETRAYALALFLATAAITTYPFEPRKEVSFCFLGTCLLLSLAHYFGLILVGVLLGFCFFENLKDKTKSLKIAGAGLLALIWPLHHAISGSILGKSGGNFWITTNGLLDSVRIAASGFLPRAGRFGAYIFISGVIVSLFIAIYMRSSDKDSQRDMSAISMRLGSMLGVFVALVALVDLYSPMSTARNYIVLLPLITLLIASTVSLVSVNSPIIRMALVLVILLFSIESLRVSYSGLIVKAAAYQDWKGAAKVIKQLAANRSIYFTTEARESRSRDLIANFYITKVSDGELHAEGLVLGESEIKRPALVLSGHDQNKFESLRYEMKRLGGIQVFPPSDVIDAYAAGVWLIE